MSNDIYAKLFKQISSITKMVIDGKRDPYSLSQILQNIIDNKKINNVLNQVYQTTIVVPEDYIYSDILKNIKDNNIKIHNLSAVLDPGDIVRISFFSEEPSSNGYSLSDIKDFLEEDKSVFLGIEGLFLFSFWFNKNKPKEIDFFNYICSFYSSHHHCINDDGVTMVPLLLIKNSESFHVFRDTNVSSVGKILFLHFEVLGNVNDNGCT